MRVLLVALLLCLGAAGQSRAQQQFTPYPTTQLELVGESPPQPTNLTVNYSGPAGSDAYYYWVLATHPRGQSALTGAVQVSQVGVLSASNSIAIGWPRVAGATSYSVLRTTSAAGPSGTCTCLVVTTTATNAMDAGAALTSFTVASIASVTATINVDNSSETQPFYNTRLAGSNFRIPLVGPFTAGSNAAFDSRGNLVDGVSVAPASSTCEGSMELRPAQGRNGSTITVSSGFISDGITETALYAPRFATSRFNNGQADALYFHWETPDCFTLGTTDVTLSVFWVSDGNTGAAEFDVSTLCRSSNELMNAALGSANQLTTNASTSTADTRVIGSIALDMTGCAAEETQIISLVRQLADPYNGDVYMYSVKLDWTE